MADDLEALRREIRAADKAILEHVARRLKAAQKIGMVKRKKGLPVRNFDVEAEVIAQARELCRRHKLSQQFGEELMRMLIRASVESQAKDGRRSR